MSYQRSIYDQYADYVPRSGSDSKKVRDYAERQYKSLLENDLWEDKSTCFTFLQQVNQDIIGIPSAEDHRKKQQQAQQQRPSTVTVGEPSSNYHVFQQPQSSQFTNAPQPSQPVPYGVTSDMRVPSSNALDKLKSLRANLQQQLGTSMPTSSNNSSVDFSRADQDRSYRKGERLGDVDGWNPNKHVSWQPPAVTSTSDSLEDMVARMQASNLDNTHNFPHHGSQRPSTRSRTASGDSKGSSSLRPHRASSPTIPVSSSSSASAASHSQVGESAQSVPSTASTNSFVEDVNESSEEDDNDDDSSEEELEDDLETSAISIPSPPTSSSLSQAGDAITFVSNASTASTPPAVIPPVAKEQQAPQTTAATVTSPAKSTRSEAQNDNLRISKESQVSSSSTKDSLPAKKVTSKPSKYIEYETSDDEEEINMSGSFQSFHEQRQQANRHSKQHPASPKMMPDIHIHNHFPATTAQTFPHQNYANTSLPTYQPMLMPAADNSSSNVPRIAYNAGFDENSRNQYFNNGTSNYRDNNRKVVVNGLDTLRESIDLSGLTLQRIRDITGHY